MGPYAKHTMTHTLFECRNYFTSIVEKEYLLHSHSIKAIYKVSSRFPKNYPECISRKSKKIVCTILLQYPHCTSPFVNKLCVLIGHANWNNYNMGRYAKHTMTHTLFACRNYFINIVEKEYLLHFHSKKAIYQVSRRFPKYYPECISRKSKKIVCTILLRYPHCTSPFVNKSCVLIGHANWNNYNMGRYAKHTMTHTLFICRNYLFYFGDKNIFYPIFAIRSTR